VTGENDDVDDEDDEDAELPFLFDLLFLPFLPVWYSPEFISLLFDMPIDFVFKYGVAGVDDIVFFSLLDDFDFPELVNSLRLAMTVFDFNFE